MGVLESVEERQLKKDIPEFYPGSTVRVYVRVIEGKNERIQVFEGVVIARKHGGLRETFTVRKVSSGIGVERIFPLHSPKIERIEVVKHGKVRRAKLYYLRGLSKRSSRLKEKDTRGKEE
ncbi:MAG: 50S ribosomal protein L19 [bacterium]